MERDILKINEDLCNGCGDCVPNCHEGALQIIDGKVRLVSELMCDGLGACIGHCPLDAITIEKREAQPYNETLVMKEMLDKGKNTIIAHLTHLKDHNETEYLKEGITFLKENEKNLKFSLDEVLDAVHNHGKQEEKASSGCGGGCPGSKTMSFNIGNDAEEEKQISGKSELAQWPVQMHLINPNAPYFRNADVVVAADCVAFSLGNFHQEYLKGKSLAIACPKLDQGQEVYAEKIISMIDDANVNTITVMIMEVPCCGGLLQMVKTASAMAKRNVPVKAITVGVQGNIVSEEWV